MRLPAIDPVAAVILLLALLLAALVVSALQGRHAARQHHQGRQRQDQFSQFRLPVILRTVATAHRLHKNEHARWNASRANIASAYISRRERPARAGALKGMDQ